MHTRYMQDICEVLRIIEPIDTVALHICPYKTKQDKLMAILSIEAKLHGAALDRVFALISSLDADSDVRSVTCTRQLQALELSSLHPGLQFKTESMTIPFMSSLPERVTSMLNEVPVTLRSDISIVIAELLTRECIWQYLKWNFEEERDSDGVRRFSGFYTADCWKDFEASLGVGTRARKFAGLLLFSDSTNLLKFGNKSVHPIYICPGGLKYENMGTQSMTLLGFIPEVPVEIRSLLTQQQRKEFAKWTRQVLAQVYKNIITSIHRLTEQGIPLATRNGIEVIFPFVITVITDHLEGNQIAQLDNLDCRYCILDKSQYSQIDIPGRVRTCSQPHASSFEEHRCTTTLCALSCSELAPFQVFSSAHCIFHDVDEGIWKWVLKELVIPAFQNASDQRQLAQLISHQSNVPGFVKVGTITTTSTSSMTAHSMRQLLVQTVANLGAWVLLDQRRDSMFLLVLRLCKWYAVVRSRSVRECDLESISTMAVEIRMHLRNAYKDFACSGTKDEVEYSSEAVKHHTILHYDMLIKRYGAPLYFSCEKFDSAHKKMIKDHVRVITNNDCTNTIICRVRFHCQNAFYYLFMNYY